MSFTEAELARFAVDLAGDTPVEVHLFDLDRVGVLDPSATLESERVRAERFHKPEDGRRFIVRRVLLRRLLGGRCDREPIELESTPDEFGRPRIEGIGSIRFNTSRSGALFAVALLEGADQGVEPGIDIETDRFISDAASVGRRILSGTERDALGVDHRMDAGQLLRIWTRKEAVLKAVGRGLTIDPSFVSVPCQPHAVLERVTVKVPLEGGPCTVFLQDPPLQELPEGLLMAVALAVGV